MRPKIPPKPWKQLEAKDIPKLRDDVLKEQKGKCGICGTTDSNTIWTLDHAHKKRFGSSGLIRGVLCRSCNSVEGKIVNALKRFGIKIHQMSDWLRSLADYLDKPHYPFVHPTERTVIKIGKRDFNKLMDEYVKKYPKRNKLKYPKGGKASKRLEEIIKEFDV